MTESVEWERLADHDASMPAPRPSLCDYCGMDRRVHDSRTWMAHCEATAAAYPDVLKQMRAERDAAKAEIAKVRERVAAQVTDHLRRRAHDAAIADVNAYSCEAAVTWMAAAQLVESGEWKAADDG